MGTFRRATTSAISAAVVGVMLMSGCASQPAEPEPEVEAVEETPEPEPTPTQPPVASANVSELGAIVGIGPKVIVFNAASQYYLFGPGTEQGGVVTPSTDQSTAEVLETRTSAQHAPDSDIAFAYVTLEKAPNDGLKAGGFDLVMKTYDIEGELLSNVSTPSFEHLDIGTLSLVGSTLYLRNGGLTADAELGATNLDAIDVETGAVKWTVKCGNGYAGSDAIYATPTTIAIGCDTDGFVGLDVATGQRAWKQVGGNTQAFGYDPSAPGVANAAEYAGEADVTVDIITGQLLDEEPSRTVLGDPVTGFQAYGRLKVYDPKTHAPVFEIASDQISQLGDFQTVSAFDGRLTFIASDGLNIVSLTDGTADPTSPPKASRSQGYNYVVADAGTGWVLLGTMDANWNPDSWAPNNAPITATTILWTPDPEGALSWEDLPTVTAFSG